jgi:hypothetical protein
MESKAGKKRISGVVSISALLVLVAAFSYIWASTNIIDEMSYREQAYALQDYSPHIIDWEEAKVTLVKLADEPCITPNIFAAKANRYLLFLNGGYAVKVEMRTDIDGLLGPSVMYFNPFTKQYIGGALRY